MIKETSNQSIIWNIHLQYPLGKFKLISYVIKQGRKRPLDTPKRMIERRKERERKVKGEI